MTRWKMREPFFKGKDTYAFKTDGEIRMIEVDADGIFTFEGKPPLALGIIAKHQPEGAR